MSSEVKARGAISHLKYLWKTGEKQRFLVTAESVESTGAIFSGHWFHPEQKKWMLISSWKAPREAGFLRGLHSFSENFDGETGHFVHRASFGNQWVHGADRSWTEVTSAAFSHDPTGATDRFDRFMGVKSGEFFLSHGGFIDGSTEYGREFIRSATGNFPADITLPASKQ